MITNIDNKCLLASLLTLSKHKGLFFICTAGASQGYQCRKPHRTTIADSNKRKTLTIGRILPVNLQHRHW